MKKQSYSNAIANAITSFLKEDGWKFSFDKEIGLIKTGMSIKSTIHSICYFILIKSDKYIVYAASPISPNAEDKDMMAKMAEFICRANFYLMNGQFDLDMDDGELRFKCFVDCDGGTIPTREIIKNSIYYPAAMFKYHGVGIADIIFRNSTAEDAIKLCKITAEQSLISFLKKRILESEDEEDAAANDELSDDSEDSNDELPFLFNEPKSYKTDLFGTDVGGENS